MTAISLGVKGCYAAELLPMAVLLGCSCIAAARCLSWRRAPVAASGPEGSPGPA
jgi:hypothetical protein